MTEKDIRSDLNEKEFSKWLKQYKLQHLEQTFKNSGLDNLEILKLATNKNIEAIIKKLGINNDANIVDQLNLKLGIQKLKKVTTIIHEDEHKSLIEIEDLIKYINDFINSAKNELQQNCSVNNIKKEIEICFESIYNELNERKKYLFKQTDEMVLYKQNVLKEQLTIFEKRLAETNDIKNKCDNLLLEPISLNSNELTQRKTQIFNLTDIVRKNIRNKLPIIPCKIQFLLSNSNDILSMINNLGTISKYVITINSLKNIFHKRFSAEIKWSLQCINAKLDIYNLFEDDRNLIVYEWNNIWSNNLNWNSKKIKLNKCKNDIINHKIITTNINDINEKSLYQFRLKLVYYDKNNDAQNIISSDCQQIMVQYLDFDSRSQYTVYGYIRKHFVTLLKTETFDVAQYAQLVFSYLGCIFDAVSVLSKESMNCLIGWFSADSFNVKTQTWADLCGKNNHISRINGKIAKYVDDISGMNYIYGGVNDQITFPSSLDLPLTYTLIHVTRYNKVMGNGNKMVKQSRKRIINCSNYNWLSGHWSGVSGVCHHGGWLTAHNIDNHGDKWVVSVDQATLYRSNGVKRSHSSGRTQPITKLMINHGACPEHSHWGIGHVFIFNQILNIDEITKMERYLMQIYKVEKSNV